MALQHDVGLQDYLITNFNAILRKHTVLAHIPKRCLLYEPDSWNDDQNDLHLPAYGNFSVAVDTHKYGLNSKEDEKNASKDVIQRNPAATKA